MCSYHRFLDGKTVKFPSISVALLALEAAKKYQLQGFQLHATNFLLAGLRPGNVLQVIKLLLLYRLILLLDILVVLLQVLQTAYLYSSLNPIKEKTRGKHRDSFSPSAPSLEELEEQESRDNEENSEHEMFDTLTTKCLVLTDLHTEEVLASSSWPSLPLPLVHLVLSRDSLSPVSEASVLRALDRWAREYCRKQVLS